MSEKSPPILATWLLHLFIKEEFREEVTADLLDQYDDKLKTSTPFAARMDYWRQVLHYFRPFALRRYRYRHTNHFPMYKNYLTTAIRSTVNNKLHAFINIAGLSIGMAVSIVIGLWIIDELSFNKAFDKYERVGQVIQNVTNNGEVQTWFNLPLPLADELRKNYNTDFAHIAMTTRPMGSLVKTETLKLIKNGIFAEPEFTKIFNLPMLEGSAQALTDPSNLLISESTARTYFDNVSPIGKTLIIESRMSLTVAGIYKDFPMNSQFFNVQFIGAWEMLYAKNDFKSMGEPWRPNMFFVYVELNPHANFKDASDRIRDAKLKNVSELLKKKKPALLVHPMNHWHLYGEFKNGKEVGGRIQYVWLFAIVGTFVLLMACINFMNLSTARSEKRAKEVGIRKAIGSRRSQLIGQFFVESIMTSLLSFVIALILVQLLLPTFNEIAEKNVHLGWTSLTFWMSGLSFSIIIGLIAGSYPALYLSSIKAISTIKGSFKAGSAASIPRKVMVTIQFTVSIILIIGTITVFLQIQHAKDRPMGYESNGLVLIPLTSDDAHDHFDVIQHELEKSDAIVSLAEAASPTTESFSSSSGFDWNGKNPDLSVDFNTVGVSHDYGKTIGWNVEDGRDFSRDFPSDSSALIINQAAADFMGLKNPVGEVIRWHDEPLTIVGVIKNVIVKSPYDQVGPNVYYLSKGRQSFFIARINPITGAHKAIENIESVMKEYKTDIPFSYEFIDQVYDRKFGNEQRIGNLATIFAVLAILISCLGIFGLSSFMAEQKTKEIGVRKVLGASVFQLWKLMCTDFLSLVMFSCVVAIPVAYWLLSGWLKSYTYHVDLPWWSFVISGLGTLSIMILTVSWHTLAAARINPSKSLRSE